ncbi:13417_t:CDS:1, partial [Cetraspora pellucida]
MDLEISAHSEDDVDFILPSSKCVTNILYVIRNINEVDASEDNDSANKPNSLPVNGTLTATLLK